MTTPLPWVVLWSWFMGGWAMLGALAWSHPRSGVPVDACIAWTFACAVLTADALVWHQRVEERGD